MRRLNDKSRLRAGLLLLLLLLPALQALAAIRHVRPADALASDSGEGSRAHPWKTLAYAASQLQPGDTLVIAAGLYRESLLLGRRDWSSAKPTTIVAEGRVELRGTDLVQGWEKLGGGVFVKRNWPQEPQQVLVAGRALKQLGGTIFEGYPQRPDHDLAGLHADQGGIWPTRVAGGEQALQPDSFWYDANRKWLYVRVAGDASLTQAEVAVRTWLLRAEQASGLTVRGLRFRYSNTSTLSRQGAVTVQGHGNRLEQLVVEDADGVGIELDGHDNQLLDCEVARAGYLGIKARGERNTIAGNRVHHNNTRGFNKWWEAGGMKFIGDDGLRHSRVVRNQVAWNTGDGIWFDWGNDDNLIGDNQVAYNSGFGIHYEASSRARILGNSVFGNGQRGIYLAHSRDSRVEGNLVLANALEGMVAIDEKRQDPEGRLDLRPRNNRFFGNVLAWNRATALILPGASLANVSDSNVYVQDDGGPRFAMGWPKLWKPSMDLADWRTREGQDLHSRVLRQAMSPALKAALARQALDPDLSELKRLASPAVAQQGGR
jgi:parallel beta-helix repeat protein